jgi:hypothetical protein
MIVLSESFVNTLFMSPFKGILKTTGFSYTQTALSPWSFYSVMQPYILRRN